MKRTTTNLMLAAILLSSSVYAQSTKLTLGLQPNQVSTPHTGTVAGKSTATESRPIAAANYLFTSGVSYEFDDTTLISYSGERGCDSFLTNIKYDQYISRKMVSNVLTNVQKSNITYDGNDNGLTQLDQTWNAGLSTWVNSLNVIFTYDGDNNLLTYITQNWNSGTSSWDNSSKYTYTYDGDNNMLTEVRQYWDGGTMSWLNAEKQLYSYDVNNNELAHIQQYWNSGTTSWDNSTRTTNTYNVDNDRTLMLRQGWNSGTSSWDNSYQDIYTYDGNHHMLTDINQDFILAVWQNDEKYTFAYSGNDMTSVTEQNWNIGTSSWDNSGKMVFAYDGNHNRLSEIEQPWNAGTNSFENDKRSQYTYNGYNQPTALWTDKWNSGIWEVTTTDKKQYIYYEEYTVASVANTTAANNFKVYPVPAQNVVTIEKTWAQPQDFTVSVIDLQGRLVRNYSEKAVTNYSRNIDVNQLPAGNYVLKLSTKNGKAAYQQFTVMH
jgi:hypothetical protein